MTLRQTLSISGFCLLCAGCTVAPLHEPLPNAAERKTPLHFGLYVTADPAHNPISPPERFVGYHVATDFEVSKEELDTDVPVFAICTGKVLYSGFAEGYGGLLIHRCNMKEGPVTVMYGHLKIDGLPKVGSTVKNGQQVAMLGAARSHDTDGNRKHLHLGIHRGTEMVTLGYVQAESDLHMYIDPQAVLPTATVAGMSPDMTPYWQLTGSGS